MFCPTHEFSNHNKISNILSLQNSNLSCSLPSSIANLTQLEYLDLSSYDFIGTIPSSFVDGLKHLISLYLYDNSLEGSIPSSLFSHSTLRFLLPVTFRIGRWARSLEFWRDLYSFWRYKKCSHTFISLLQQQCLQPKVSSWVLMMLLWLVAWKACLMHLNIWQRQG